MIRDLLTSIKIRKIKAFSRSPQSLLGGTLPFFLLSFPAVIIVYYYYQYSLYPDYDAALYFNVSDKLYQIYVKDGLLSYLGSFYTFRSWVPTLFPALGSIFLIITGGKYIWALALMSCTLYILFSHFTYFLIKEIHGKKTASLLCTYAIITLPFIYEVSFEFMAELPFITCAMAALYFFTRLWNKKIIPPYTAFAISLTLAILIRPSLSILIFFIPFISWILITRRKVTLEVIQLILISIVSAITLLTYYSFTKAGILNCCVQWEIRCIENDATFPIIITFLILLFAAPLLFKAFSVFLRSRYQLTSEKSLSNSIWIVYFLSLLWYLPHLDKLAYWTIGLSYDFESPHQYQIIPFSQDFELLCDQKLIYIVFSFFLINFLFYVLQKKSRKEKIRIDFNILRNKQILNIYYMFISSLIVLHSVTNQDPRYSLFTTLLLFIFLFISILQIGTDRLQLKKIFLTAITLIHLHSLGSFFFPESYEKQLKISSFNLAQEFYMAMHSYQDFGGDPKKNILNFLIRNIEKKEASVKIQGRGIVVEEPHTNDFLTNPNAFTFIAHNNKLNWNFIVMQKKEDTNYTLTITDKPMKRNEKYVNEYSFFNKDRSLQFFCYLYKN